MRPGPSRCGAHQNLFSSAATRAMMMAFLLATAQFAAECSRQNRRYQMETAGTLWHFWMKEVVIQTNVLIVYEGLYKLSCGVHQISD